MIEIMIEKTYDASHTKHRLFLRNSSPELEAKRFQGSGYVLREKRASKHSKVLPQSNKISSTTSALKPVSEVLRRLSNLRRLVIWAAISSPRNSVDVTNISLGHPDFIRRLTFSTNGRPEYPNPNQARVCLELLRTSIQRNPLASVLLARGKMVGE